MKEQITDDKKIIFVIVKLELQCSTAKKCRKLFAKIKIWKNVSKGDDYFCIQWQHSSSIPYSL